MNEPVAVSPHDNEVARVVALAEVVGLDIRPDDLLVVAQILTGILEAGERLQKDLPIDIVPTDDPYWPDQEWSPAATSRTDPAS